MKLHSNFQVKFSRSGTKTAETRNDRTKGSVPLVKLLFIVLIPTSEYGAVRPKLAYST